MHCGSPQKNFELFFSYRYPLDSHKVFSLALVAKSVDVVYVQEIFDSLADIDRALGILRATKVSPRG